MSKTLRSSNGLFLLRLIDLMNTPKQPLSRYQEKKILSKISKEIESGNLVVEKGNYFEVTEPSGLVFVTRNFTHRMVITKND